MAERRILWHDMCNINVTYAQDRYPWIVLGDFNITLSSREHSRAKDYLTNQTGMKDFQETVLKWGFRI